MSKQLLRSAKNVMNGYSQAQVLVRNATSNDEYGPSLDQMEELAERTYSAVEFFEIMVMLDRRLNDKPKNWRHVAKSLTVTDYLVRTGAEACVDWARENMFIIRKLTEFVHVDESSGTDHGQLIRVKAKELIALLRDDERLKEERNLRLGRGKKNPQNVPETNPDGVDPDLKRALEESRITAEEEERRRKLAEKTEDAEELQAALQLSKEEEELRKLRELQQQREQQMAFWQQQQVQQVQYQQQPMYYDIFGNPITLEEYLQYQQQQEQAQQQQLAQQQLLAQQLAEQQASADYYAQQQFLAQQRQMAEQQYLAQKQYLSQQQQPLQSGVNNPFSLNNMHKLESENYEKTASTSFGSPPGGTAGRSSSSTPLQQQPPQKPFPQTQPPSQSQSQPQSQPQQLQATRTGNQSISDKYGELNALLATGTGIDTFGNTGQARISSQHTKTETFINSHGTGFKQVSNEPPKHNPFLTTQYTGLPSTNIVPSHTGYGFGNASSFQQTASKPNDQGMSLIDL
ncbi:epsin Ecym_4731 [Eremothecium cymbalariae DBVPG|uniref:ENTH domain-containing protein n=1 Tax=Eremothecium cymbalariae (strain CBS 270.75 / DBVPG 7215 / KCTC 17166 / NRRL Y-17582) TaxID=931890 RepID=G8JSM7_ERECY|nr:hypothetical protein Ecym_4731 [Eremothecium cymbalariae DBVPG\